MNNRRGSLIVTYTPDAGAAQADADLVALESGTTSTILRTGMPESYFHQLRLRAQQDPSWLSHITVCFTDANGVQHRIGLTQEDELRWPPGFMDELWRIETEIGDARRPARALAAGPQPEEGRDGE